MRLRLQDPRVRIPEPHPRRELFHRERERELLHRGSCQETVLHRGSCQEKRERMCVQLCEVRTDR